MNIKFERDLVCFDIESTSADAQTARIVEICVIKISHIDKARTKFTLLINPEMHIPEDATEIHGITDADVENCPTFRVISKGLLAQIKGNSC